MTKLILTKTEFKKIFDNYDLIQNEAKKQKILKFIVENKAYICPSKNSKKIVDRFLGYLRLQKKAFDDLEDFILLTFRVEKGKFGSSDHLWHEKTTDSQKDLLYKMHKLGETVKYLSNGFEDLLNELKVEERYLYNFDCD